MGTVIQCKEHAATLSDELRQPELNADNPTLNPATLIVEMQCDPLLICVLSACNMWLCNNIGHHTEIPPAPTGGNTSAGMCRVNLLLWCKYIRHTGAGMWEGGRVFSHTLSQQINYST